MDKKKAKEIELVIEKLVIYIVAVFALVIFLKCFLNYLEYDSISKADKEGLIISSVLLIAFIWYKLVYIKKE